MLKNSEKILITHKDKSSRTMLRYLLEIEHYQVTEACELDDVRNVLKGGNIDIVLLDATWEVTSLNTLLEFIVTQFSLESVQTVLIIPEGVSPALLPLYQQLPVSHQIRRPFSPRDLIAMLKRCSHASLSKSLPSDLSELDITFNREQCTLKLDQQEIRLSKIEFDLFRYFFQHPSQIFSRQDLLDAVWGMDSGIEERTVDVHIRRLRRVLKPMQLDKQIQTVHGAGYRFCEALVMPV